MLSLTRIHSQQLLLGFFGRLMVGHRHRLRLRGSSPGSPFVHLMSLVYFLRLLLSSKHCRIWKCFFLSQIPYSQQVSLKEFRQEFDVWYGFDGDWVL
jgi:hypothetical protein